MLGRYLELDTFFRVVKGNKRVALGTSQIRLSHDGSIRDRLNRDTSSLDGTSLDRSS